MVPRGSAPWSGSGAEAPALRRSRGLPWQVPLGTAYWQHLCTIRCELQSARGPAIRLGENIKTFRSLINHQLQILGKQVSLRDEALCRLPDLIQVSSLAGVTFGDRWPRVAACFPGLLRGGEWHGGADQVGQLAWRTDLRV